MKNLANLVLAGASLMAIAAPATVMAQTSAPTAAEDGEEDLANEIVVSTRRRDEGVQDVPATVQAVTAESIDKLNLRKMEDIQAVVPGLSLVPNANGIGSVATVRGVDFNVNVSGNNGTLEFYINDGPISSNVLFLSMFDIGQIEVARGPQGTLRGRSAPSGAVNVTMRKPDLSEFGANASFTATSIDALNANGAVNIPIIKDKLAVRFGGVISGDHGSRFQPRNDALPLKNDTHGYRASVRADPFDGLLVLDFMYMNVDRISRLYDGVESANTVNSVFGASPVTLLAKDRESVDGFPREGNQGFAVYNGSIALSVAGQKLIYTGQRMRQRLISFDPSDDAGLFTNDTAGGNRFGQPTNTFSRSTSHEVRLQNDDRIAGIFDYTIGNLRYNTSAETNLLSPTGIGVLTPRVLAAVALTPILRPGSSQETSYFGNLTAHLGEKFELAGGLRSIKYKNQAGLFVSGVENLGFRQNATDKATIYSGSAKFKLSDSFMVYASTGTSWRPEAIAIQTAVPAPTPQQLAFLRSPPEESTSYEAGIKSKLMDDKVTFNLTAYQQKFKNYPYRAPGVGVYAINPANGSVVNVNFVSGVPVKVTGLEAEFGFNPSDNFSFGGVIGYAKGNISNGIIPCTDLNGDGNPDVVTAAPSAPVLSAAVGAAGVDSCTTSQRSTNAARLSASFQSEYNMDIGSQNGYLRGLLSMQGNSQNDPVNAFDDVKKYAILNLYAGVRSQNKDWDISLFAKNVTNTFRVLARSNGPIATALRGGVPLGPLGTSAGSSSLTNYFGDLRLTEPREFGVNLRFSFGSR